MKLGGTYEALSFIICVEDFQTKFYSCWVFSFFSSPKCEAVRDPRRSSKPPGSYVSLSTNGGDPVPGRPTSERCEGSKLRDWSSSGLLQHLQRFAPVGHWIRAEGSQVSPNMNSGNFILLWFTLEILLVHFLGFIPKYSWQETGRTSLLENKRENQKSLKTWTYWIKKQYQCTGISIQEYVLKITRCCLLQYWYSSDRKIYSIELY